MGHVKQWQMEWRKLMLLPMWYKTWDAGIKQESVIAAWQGWLITFHGFMWMLIYNHVSNSLLDLLTAVSNQGPGWVFWYNNCHHKLMFPILTSLVVVVILFPEEYTKHMHNIITVISQNVFLWRLPEKLRDSSSWQPLQSLLWCIVYF